MIRLTRLTCPDPDKLKTDYKYHQNKEALMMSSFGKCMYCESKIGHIDYGDVEHIMPKSLFPDKTFLWENLGYACPKCNRESKKDLYDVNFINPFENEPLDSMMIIGGIYSAKKGSICGQITIDILKLNRPELLQNRNVSLVSFSELIARYNTSQNIVQREAIKALIEDEISNDKEYSACKKSYWELSN